MKKYKRLYYRDRLKIEDLLNENHSVIDIARRLGVCRQTIYNEIERGKYLRQLTDLRVVEAYSADIAQQKVDENMSVCGTSLKIGDNLKLAEFIENKIIDEKYSPAAVAAEIKNMSDEFGITLCFRTIYNYIDQDIFYRLTNKDLPMEGKAKRKYNKVKEKPERKKNFGTSIEERPKEIESREEFGNWEMDSVVGPQKKSKCCLLVLTERKTRFELVRLLKDHTAASVVDMLDQIEREYGDAFSKVFQTITCDNGSEFADSVGIERSSIGDGTRTKVYYCHPYTPSERGSNEVANRLIRRHIKKKVVFDDKTPEDIMKIQDWMNDYPRRIHNYDTARHLYEIEMENMMAAS